MFVRAANPIWFFNNLVGQPVDDTYFAFFLTNTLPYLPQAVYLDPNGNAVWANPLEFGPNAGLPNNLYFDPTLVYRIEIRQGPTQNDPLIGDPIENFVPGESSSTISNNFTNSINLITNPQFADIFFGSPDTITVAGTYNIAPGWNLVITGTGGTTTLTQVNLLANTNAPGNPPYALKIVNTGWASVELVQQFNFDGALFRSGSIAMSLLVKPMTLPEPITLNYETSDGSIILVASKTLPNDVWTTLSNAINLGISNNNNNGAAAYTQMQIVLPTTGTVTITNAQFIGQSSPVSTISPTPSPLFQEMPLERQRDYEFHVYKDSLITQPKESILTGWNFGLNPWQFWAIAGANVATNTYTADQTIIAQQAYVTSATGNNVNVGQSVIANNYGIQITALTAHNNFAMIQYIDAATIAPYWGSLMSSMVTAMLHTTHSTTVRFKMRLIYNASLPSTIAQHEPITSWVEGSDPVFAAGWGSAIPINDPIYTLTSTPTQFAFDQFQLPQASTTTATLGIVFYTIDNMNSAATADYLLVNDISLVRNNFAIKSNVLSFDETLRRCQFYYETSYEPNTVPGTGGAPSEFSVVQNAFITGPNVSSLSGAFQLQFNSLKRIAPSVTFFGPVTGTSNKILVNLWLDATQVDSTEKTALGGGASWTQTDISKKGAYYTSTSNSAIGTHATGGSPNVYATGNFHYVADARLGI